METVLDFIFAVKDIAGTDLTSNILYKYNGKFLEIQYLYNTHTGDNTNFNVHYVCYRILCLY